MNYRIFLLLILTLIGSYGYGQVDSNAAINDSIAAINVSIEAINDSIAKAPDTVSTKELKKKRKRLIQYKKISSYNDTLILVNNDIIVGEFKKMDKSVVIFKTKYSEKDFNIKWHRVKEIYSDRFFVVALSDGRRVSSTIHSVRGASKKVLLDMGIYAKEENLNDIVYLEPIGKNFLSRLTVDVDFGVTLTKANNFRQLTSSITAKYIANKWSANGSYGNVFSTQDGAADINRMDGELSLIYFLPKDWYINVSAIYLSNDDQLLDLRSTYRAGMGYFFIRNSKMYVGAAGGLAYTSEDYLSDEPTRNSSESYLGISFNKYDIGDLSLVSSAVLYPSISEEDRYRVDFNFDMKYDLPLDFYIKMSVTYNYDNQPAEGAANEDYVFTTSFGWEFN